LKFLLEASFSGFMLTFHAALKICLILGLGFVAVGCGKNGSSSGNTLSPVPATTTDTSIPIIPAASTTPIAPYATYKVPRFDHMELLSKDKATVVTMIDSSSNGIPIRGTFDTPEIYLNYPESPISPAPASFMNLLNLQTGELSQTRVSEPKKPHHDWNKLVNPGFFSFAKTFANTGSAMISRGLIMVMRNGKEEPYMINELWTINNKTGTISAQQLEIKDNLTLSPCSAISADGNQVISLASVGKQIEKRFSSIEMTDRIIVWDRTTGKVNPSLSNFKITPKPNVGVHGEHGDGHGCSLRWSPNGSNAPLLAMVGESPFSDNAITIWNLAPGKPQIVIQTPTDNVHAISLSHDGKLLAGNTSTGIKLWDARTGELLRDTSYLNVTEPGSTLLSIKFTSDDKTLVVGIGNNPDNTGNPDNTADKGWSIALWQVESLVRP
jgi:hypothetical protein